MFRDAQMIVKVVACVLQGSAFVDHDTLVQVANTSGVLETVLAMDIASMLGANARATMAVRIAYCNCSLRM